MIITHAFLDGIRTVDKNAEIFIADLVDYKIVPCRGCYTCWSHISEGQCIMTRRKVDDMNLLIDKYAKSDKVIYSTPLHFYNISSHLQVFLERTMPFIKPLVDPAATEEEKRRIPTYRDMAVICTCKQVFNGTWDAVASQMKLLSRGKYQAIFSTQPIPNSLEQKEKVTQYLNVVAEAGGEFAQDGFFSARLKRRLEEAMAMMNNAIGIPYLAR